MAMKRRLSILAFVMILALALSACGGDESNKEGSDGNDTEAQADGQSQESGQGSEVKGQVAKGKTVATVNGEKIKGSEFNTVLQAVQQQSQKTGQKVDVEQAKNQAVQSLVGQELILQDAKAKGYEASEEDINNRIEKTKSQFESDEQFKKVMKQQGLTMEKYKNQLSEQLTVEQYTEKEIDTEKVTDKEAKDYYDKYSKDAEDAPKYEKVKSQIKQGLQEQRKQKARAEIVKDLKKDGDVEVNI
ncbi:SurA N-terminal domain-containing protein [Tuberibacillus sp. Marseille-P3662]|uniref:SurA N-terminal domain-containing protein n=1 Tax=Tuberibacillus sp. Marseille-P3662 TaxID=1965358 RepID=UPI000A1CEFFF|nr:SurA N-terminal domain-containing protein [Tuberibacillus sp. Marseille-P3662]